MKVVRGVGAAALAATMLAACGTAQSNVGNVAQPLPTPVASWSPAVSGTLSVLTSALAAAGYQLFPPVAPYRPSEPASLTETPRVVRQVSGPDQDQGFVVVYDFPTTAAAATAGSELATYMASGFGQTNFPLDAQFSVSQVGSTLVFTWYSAARSDDAAAAQGAFDAIRSVGQAFPVVK